MEGDKKCVWTGNIEGSDVNTKMMTAHEAEVYRLLLHHKFTEAVDYMALHYNDLKSHMTFYFNIALDKGCDADVARRFVRELGVRVDERREYDGTNRTDTPLFTALKRRPHISVEFLQVLLSLADRSRDYYAALSFEKSPLVAAAQARAILEKVRSLRDVGCDINIKTTSNRSLLHVAFQHRYCEETTNDLMLLGADVGGVTDAGDTTLTSMLSTYAYEPYRSQWIQTLVEQGVDVNHANSSGMTALMYAVMNSYPLDVVDQLLAMGANANFRDENDNTTLRLAIRYHRSIEIFESLVNAGANIHRRKERKDRGVRGGETRTRSRPSVVVGPRSEPQYRR